MILYINHDTIYRSRPGGCSTTSAERIFVIYSGARRRRIFVIISEHADNEPPEEPAYHGLYIVSWSIYSIMGYI